jgi:hypothetical protein
MLKQAIELLKKLSERTFTMFGAEFSEEVDNFIIKAEHYKPTIYLEIRGGVLTSAYATEQMVVSLFDWDNYESDPSYKTDKTIDPDEWEHMIDSGINSGQLVSLSIE